MEQTFRSIRLWTGTGLLSLLLLVTGCDRQSRETGSTGNENSPEFAAVQFAESIYQDDNIDIALGLSTQRMRRILNNYRTNRNIQRHVLNLKYDTVVIKPDGGNRIGRTEFSEEATVTLFFSGTYDDDRIEDLRSVKLLRQGGLWKVDRITDDYW